MKRFFTMIVAACALFAVFAQNPMVTLSHDGELKFFNDLSALEDALEAAADGDILYLTEGFFTANTDTVTIDKRLSFIGSGYESRITCHIKVDLRNVTSDEIDMPMFDGVRLRTLRFHPDSTNRNKTNNASVRKCYIEFIDDGGYAAKNFLIDRCFLGKLDVYGARESNITVKNSKIKELPKGVSSVAQITLINCTVNTLDYLPKVTINSILGRALATYTVTESRYNVDGSPALYNSLTTHNFMNDGVSTSNCYLRESITWIDANNVEVDDSDFVLKGYLGQDGTIVGINGGETPYSENPSVPTVDTANSSVEYDVENNKLKVSITVKAD